MIKFLKTNGTSYYIENIISEASQLLILVTPYLKLTRNLFSRLKETDRKGVTIILVYGKSELSIEQKQYLSQLSNLNLYYLKDLHAKCYINEKHMVISSMNLHEYSERNNWEMSILISRDEDFLICDEILKEVDTIIGAAKTEKISKQNVSIIPKDDRDEVVKFLNQLLNTDKFFVKRTTIKDGFFVDYDLERYTSEIIAEDYPYEGINFYLDNKLLQIEFKYTPTKVKKINDLLKYNDLSDNYRIYVNRPEIISIYKSIEIRDKWGDITLTEKKEYWGNIIKIMSERLILILNQINNGK